jgi:ribosomal protein L32
MGTIKKWRKKKMSNHKRRKRRRADRHKKKEFQIEERDCHAYIPQYQSCRGYADRYFVLVKWMRDACGVSVECERTG